MTKDDSKNPVDMLATMRAENSGFFVALAIGLFVIIQLLAEVEELSITWLIFSVVYFALIIATIIAMIAWGTSIMFQNQYIRKHYPELENELKEFTQKKWLFRTSYARFFEDKDDDKIHSTVRLYYIAISIFSVLLWIAVALDNTWNLQKLIIT